MILLRSALFNVLFYINLILFLVLGFWFFALPRRWGIEALKTWARTSLFLLRVTCGIRMEVRGREYLSNGAALLAGKHQSLWETFAILPLLDDPAMIIKRELTFIPLFGWFALKFGMIPVERSAGAAALKAMLRRSEQALAAGRQLVIFPEGTRRAPDDPPDYKPGAAALYLKLGVACVPFALNSGCFWPRRTFRRYPGTIVLEFLPPIPAGLSRREFRQKLEAAIENATRQLVTEARSGGV